MTDPALEALWKRVLSDFDDEAAHGAFLDYCQQRDLLLEAAVRYRGMAADHVRGPVAQRRLQGITVLALSRLQTERTPDSRFSVTVVRLVLIALFVAGSIGLLLALNR